MANNELNPDEINNALSDLLPASARKKLYALFVLFGVLAGAGAIGFAAAGVDVPIWVLVVTAVYNFLNGFVSLVARSNVGRPGLT